MTESSFIPPERILMGPGPSNVPERVLAALSRPTIGHLDPAFVELMDEIKVLLRRAFCTTNTMTLPLSGPGSVGMEACFVNLVERDDEVIVCRNGVFGQRMTQVVKRCGGRPITVDAPWGRAVDPQRLEDTLRQHPDARVVAFVHAETSTGACSDAKTLATLARNHGCMTIVDAVTSLGGSELRVDDWGLDAVYSGSQKCLSCVPGLSPVTFSGRAMEAILARKTPVQSWFLDMSLLASYWEGEGKRSYHHTAPVNALYALHESLLILHEEGLERAWARHLRHHERLAAGLDKLDLSLAVPAAERLPQLNSVLIPAGVDDASVRGRLLSEHSLEIGVGLGELAGKVWRIGLMGHSCTEAHVKRCLSALGNALDAAS